MAKKTPAPQAVTQDKATDYLKQFSEWKQDLKQYWPEMDKCQEMYEFYKSKNEKSETGNDISLNTPFSIVESQIAKENQATLRITVKAKPDDDMGSFEAWVESVIHDAILDEDVAEIYGTFRKNREMWSRALKITGNAAGEINYCYKTQVLNGKKKVVADNPYVKVRSYKSVIFNPAMQFSHSDIYYVEDFVSMKDLESQEYKEEDGSSKGLYRLGALKVAMMGKDGQGLSDSDEDQYISGDKKVSAKRKPIQVITRWEGTRMTVLASVGSGKAVTIREATDPMKLGGHNLLLGMRYCLEGRPYAYGEIAAIYKPVRAQDTIVSQSIEIVNKYLRGSYVLGSDMDIDQFMMVLANGGAVYGDPQSVNILPVNTPPAQAFQTVEVLQQAIERAARFSLYGAGLSGQSTDKTQGTASGIQSIQAAAEPNVEIQLDDVQDMFMRPIAKKYLKMIANLMGADEVRYGLLKDENPTWVKATKNILMGEATMQDMVTAGLIDEEGAQEYLTTLEPAIDPYGQPIVDPTGQPIMNRVPIPGAEEAFVFDIDWIVDAKLDNQSAADKENQTRAELGHIQWGMSIGVPIDAQKAWTSIGKKSGYEDLDELLKSPEQLQQEQQMQMMGQMGMPPQQAPQMAQGQPETAMA